MDMELEEETLSSDAQDQMQCIDPDLQSVSMYSPTAAEVQSLRSFVCNNVHSCASKFPLEDIRRLLKLRHRLNIKGNTSIRSERSSFVAAHCGAASGSGIKAIDPTLLCRPVCAKFFRHVVRIGSALMSSWRKAIRVAVDVNGESCVTAGAIELAGTTRKAYMSKMSKMERAAQWAIQIAENQEHLPYSNIIALKGFSTWAGVYRAYTEWLIHQFYLPLTERKISYAVFLRGLRRYAKHVRLYKYCPFSKCTSCERIKKRMAASNDGYALEMLRKEQRAHADFFRGERVRYNARADHARQPGSGILSMVVDGTEQLHYGIPHFTTVTKASSKIYKMRVSQITFHSVLSVCLSGPHGGGEDSQPKIPFIHVYSPSTP
jgi:hypothetical protein